MFKSELAEKRAEAGKARFQFMRYLIYDYKESLCLISIFKIELAEYENR